VFSIGGEVLVTFEAPPKLWRANTLVGRGNRQLPEYDDVHYHPIRHPTTAFVGGGFGAEGILEFSELFS
jgi:hypothetical protein